MRKRTKIDASPLFLAVIALTLIVGALAAIRLLSSDPIEESLAGNRVVNTLFVIEDQGKPLCTYVFMHYPATRRAAIFEIPGSVGLILRNIRRVDRIDTIYDPRRINTYKNEIESLLGIDIPHTIAMSLENLGKITDLIEGVEIFIPLGVYIYQDDPILFPSGITNLDGDKAMIYITYELPEENSELAKLRRQRFFLGLLKRMGEQNESLKNSQTSRLYHSFFRTGMNQRSLIRFFDEFAKIDTDRINVQTVGGNLREISGQMLILPFWDGALIKDIVRETVRGLVVEGTFERVFTVEVLNGTQVSGLAGRTADLIRGFGYEVITVDNADSNDYDRTLIIDHTGLENAAQDFGQIIRCTNIEYTVMIGDIAELEMDIQNYEIQADFTLIIGRDFNERYVIGD